MANYLREKPPRFHHADDNNYSIQLVRWFLKPIGGWPTSSETSKIDKFLSDVLTSVSFLLLVLPMIPCAVYLALEEEDVPTKFKAVGPVSFWLMASMKYGSLILHQTDITRCLERVEADWKAVKSIEDRETMLRYAKVGRYMAGFCVVFVNSGVFSYNIVRGLTTTLVYVGNDSVDVHLLPLPVYSGIADMRNKTTNLLTLAFQFLSAFIVNSITAGACSLAAVFVMHACGQLRVVMAWLDNLIDGNGTIQQKLADIVEHHLRILSFISVIEEMMHQICFVELVGCTMNICFLGYYFITEWEQNEAMNTLCYSIIFVSMTFNIFIFCYIGEMLSHQCRLVGEAAYMADWHLLSKEPKLNFVLIIARSQIVTKITAGKFFQLSLITFGAVMRTAAAYLNILRQLIYSAG